MAKVYEVKIRSNRYSGNAEKAFTLLAAGLTIALQKAKKFVEWHEEIISVQLVAETEE